MTVFLAVSETLFVRHDAINNSYQKKHVELIFCGFINGCALLHKWFLVYCICVNVLENTHSTAIG